MLAKFFKYILILILYQSPLYSKIKNLNVFNESYLTNYFSGIVAYGNFNNSQALKFFNSSKSLIKQHDTYLEKYTFSLVLEGKVKKAINQIKLNSTKDNSNFNSSTFHKFRFIIQLPSWICFKIMFVKFPFFKSFQTCECYHCSIIST